MFLTYFDQQANKVKVFNQNHNGIVNFNNGLLEISAGGTGSSDSAVESLTLLNSYTTPFTENTWLMSLTYSLPPNSLTYVNLIVLNKNLEIYDSYRNIEDLIDSPLTFDILINGTLYYRHLMLNTLTGTEAVNIVIPNASSEAQRLTFSTNSDSDIVFPKNSVPNIVSIGLTASEASAVNETPNES